jgi:lipopolysaccharide transport system permease protein
VRSSRDNTLSVEDSSSNLPLVTFPAPGGWFQGQLSELWRYRGLLYFLIWRDIKIRYKQTMLGVAWVVVQPAATVAAFTLIFGRLAKVPSGDVPYPVFALAGLVPWGFFSSALMRGGLSLVSNANLITKVYFPRLLVPIASILAGLVDFFATLTLLGLLMAYNGLALSPTMAALPLFLLLAIVAAVGVALWLAAVNVSYRDVAQAIPFLTQMWLYASPVVYPAALVPEKWRILYALNPMVGVIEGVRWSLFTAGPFPLREVAMSAGVAVVVFVTGVLHFRWAERRFADIV